MRLQAVAAILVSKTVRCRTGKMRCSKVQHRLKTEVVMQRRDHLADVTRWFDQGEARVVTAWCHILAGPQTERAEIHMTQLLARLYRYFQAHIEAHAEHHRIGTDQHQPTFGQVADKAQRLLGKPIENIEVVRQLVPLDTTLVRHDHVVEAFSLSPAIRVHSAQLHSWLIRAARRCRAASNSLSL